MLIKMFLFIFLRQKKVTNEVNWPAVYRNGLHSLESLDLEENNIIKSRNYNWYGMYAVRNNLLLIVTLLHYRDCFTLYLSPSLGDH